MPEVNQIASRGKVIRDPVHGLIEIRPGEEYLLELIDTPEFQRLRRIRQLGVSNVTYPGAEHTRFAHSLGVLNFAGRILHQLALRYQDHDAISQLIAENEKTVKAAALLHDIGHGPFSHMIERAGVAMEKHEARTGEMITDPQSGVNQVLLRHEISVEDVRAIIDGFFPVRFLRDIVSSQLDADRMDYLLRDALMTGVEYGRYDAEWVIHALCLGLEPDKNVPADPNNLRLSLDRARGIHAAEQLIVARMHMSYQVYYHRVTRGWEAHLLCLFQLASKLALDGKLPESTPAIIQKLFSQDSEIDHARFLQLDEPALLYAFQVWAESGQSDENADLQRLASLASAFLNREKLFFAEENFDENPLEASFHKVLALQKAGAQEGVDFYHDEAKFRGYKDFGRSLANSGSESSDQSVASEAIFLADGDPSQRAVPVEQDTRALITPALTAQKPTPLNRVFIHRDFSDTI